MIAIKVFAIVIVALLFVLTIFLSTGPSANMEPNNSPSLRGIQIFPKDHIWNTRVDNLPVDAMSDVYINNLIQDTTPYPGLRHYIQYCNTVPGCQLITTSPVHYQFQISCLFR